MSDLMVLLIYRHGMAMGAMSNPNPVAAGLARRAERGLRDMIEGRVPMPNVPPSIVERDYDRMNRGLLRWF